MVTVSLTTLAAVSPWYALLMVVPAAYTAWAWRAGTDADRTGVRVRALFGQRSIPWSEITDLTRLPGDRVVAVLRGGGAVPLTAVTGDGLSRLVAAAGDGATVVKVDADLAGNPLNGRYGEPAGSG
jgi:hypothetical protein